jgi:hypothetical protein
MLPARIPEHIARQKAAAFVVHQSPPRRLGVLLRFMRGIWVNASAQTTGGHMNLSFDSEKPFTSPISFADIGRVPAAVVHSIVSEQPIASPITLADIGRIAMAFVGTTATATVLIVLLGLG